MKTLMILIMMLGLIALVGCQDECETSSADVTEQTETAVADETQPVAAEPTEDSEIVTKDSGVRYQELVVGTGPEAIDRMQVECHYTLFFADSTGLEKLERFQSSKDGGTPFRCQLGVRLIPGWSDGMLGMKEGGTRRIFIPYLLGYGEAGTRGIPGKTNLIFEIEFLKAL